MHYIHQKRKRQTEKPALANEKLSPVWYVFYDHQPFSLFTTPEPARNDNLSNWHHQISFHFTCSTVTEVFSWLQLCMISSMSCSELFSMSWSDYNPSSDFINAHISINREDKFHWICNKQISITMCKWKQTIDKRNKIKTSKVDLACTLLWFITQRYYRQWNIQKKTTWETSSENCRLDDR